MWNHLQIKQNSSVDHRNRSPAAFEVRKASLYIHFQYQKSCVEFLFQWHESLKSTWRFPDLLLLNCLRTSVPYQNLHNFTTKAGKSEAKGVWGSEVKAPLILIPGTTWRWVISFMIRPLYSQYQFGKKLDGTQSLSGRGVKDKYPYFWRE